MSEKLKTKKGDKADVKCEGIINFGPIDTKSRRDDKETWNALQFYCETDNKEAKYVSPSDEEVTGSAQERIERFKRARGIGRMAIDAAMLNVA